jgi:hypothetical protein
LRFILNPHAAAKLWSVIRSGYALSLSIVS